MDFVSSCGCDGAYGRDCGFVWVAWFFFFFFLVVDFVADCECGCDGFCEFFFWWWLAVGGWQRRERDVVGVEDREERDEEEDRERREKEF